MSKDKVLLVYPGPKVKFPRLPMSCIVLAAYLRRANFAVEILDTRVDTFEGREWADYLCIGISSMSGTQLKYAIQLAGKIKADAPDIPLIWGGAHVSFYPQESAVSPLVDYVVRGEGEETLLELAEKIKINKSIGIIPGVTFNQDNRLLSGPERKHLDMDTLLFPAYDLVILSRYADSVEGFSYETSRGCPHRCGFCYNKSFHCQSWRHKSTDKVIAELKRIKDEFNIKKIHFIDDNFMVSLPRVREICRGIKPFGLKWVSTTRADYLAKYSSEDLLVFKESGCIYLQFGAESGSLRELDYIQKDITPQQIIGAAKNCIEAGIMPVVSFMIAFPDETEQDRSQTFNLYDEIMRLKGNAEINGIFIYTPYPGTSLYTEAVRLGFKELKRLEDWSDWDLFRDAKNVPWLDRSEKDRLETIEIISTFKYYIHRLNYYSDEYRRRMLGPIGSIFYRFVIPIMDSFASFRWQHRFFSLAYEWRLWRFFLRFFPR